MSRARLRENSSTSTLPIFIGSWDGARKGRSSLLANSLAAPLAAGPAKAALCAHIVTAEHCYRRNGLHQSAAQGIFMGSPWRPRKRSEPPRGARSPCFDILPRYSGTFDDVSRDLHNLLSF